MRWLHLLWCLVTAFALAAPPPVLVLAIEGPIGPATADYLHRGLDTAAKQNAQLVVLRIDTPGGLDTSMRAIIKDILAAPMPVVSWVGPSGARAASAGTYILYASHLAAMASATNLGAATPVSIGIGGAPDKGKEAGKTENKDGKMSGDAHERKAVQDASAYIRGLAQLRGRNADWAELAVRDAVSLSAPEALRQKVIDLVADDIAQLLRQLDGRKVMVLGAERALATAGVAPVALDPDWRTDFLGTITNPTFAMVLMLLGIYAIVFEFSNPGLVLPGVVGTIALITALYALHLLPVNYAGLALILVGLAFMAAEMFLPAYGSLGIGGAIAFVLGSVILVDTDSADFRLPIAAVLGVAGASAAFMVFILRMALKSRRLPLVSGTQALVGATGEVLEDFSGEGWARVQSETWRVRSPLPMKAGLRVRVGRVDGLVLDVRPEADEAKSVTMVFSFGVGVLVLFLVLLAWSVNILREYERGVVFQLGRFWMVKGPGLVIIIPVVQQMVRLDLRTVVLDVPPQDVITRDNVSVKVNAVVYFRIVEPQKAVIQVANFLNATSQLAQTTLRAVLGKHELDELLSAREKLNLDIQHILDMQTDAWGIKVSTVEIKDVDLNDTMVRAIARQAEAERERRAKIIHAEGEMQAAEKLLQAAQILAQRPEAMQLRYMQTLSNIAGDKSSTIVFPIPMELLAPLVDAVRRPKE